jgi:hypothetical protein
MTKMQEEFGPKGVTFIGLSGEPKETVGKFLAQELAGVQGYKMAHGSSGGLQGPGTIPYTFIIGADGKVFFQGSGAPTAGKIEEALAATRAKLPKDVIETHRQERANKMLAHAESLKGQSHYAEALAVLSAMAKDRTLKGVDALAKGDALKAEIEKTTDEAAKNEIDLQKKIVAIVGGTPDRPTEKVKEKERLGMAKRLEAVQKDAAEKGAAVAEEMTKYWITILTVKR